MMPNVIQVVTMNLPTSSPRNNLQSVTEKPVASLPVMDIKNQDTEPSQPELDHAVSRLNEYIQNSRRDLHFSVDKDSGRVVVKVIDSETREVIRQIPSEEVIALAHGIGLKEPSGVLLYKKA